MVVPSILYCVVDVDYQIHQLRPAIIDQFRDNNVFSSLIQQPTNNWDSILSDIPGKPIPMYLSRDKPNTATMIFEKIYKRIPDDYINELDEEDEEDIICKLNEHIFIPSNHSHFQHGLLEQDMFDEFLQVQNIDENSDDCLYWLPLLLSVFFWERITLPKDDTLPKNDGNILQFNPEVNNPLFIQTKRFLDMICATCV